MAEEVQPCSSPAPGGAGPFRTDEADRALDGGEPEVGGFEGHEACVSGLAIYRNMLISVAMDNQIRAWSLPGGKCLHKLEGHTQAIQCLAVEGDVLATGSDDNTVRLWDLTTGQATATLTGHEEGIDAVLFHGGKLFSCSDDGSIKIWSLQEHREERSLDGHLDWVSGLALWRNLLLSCSDDGSIRAWSLEDYECLEILHVASHDEADPESYNVNCIAVSGDLLYAGVGPHILVWAIESGPLFECRMAYKGHRDDIRAVIVDDAAGRLYSCADDGTVKVWTIGVDKEMASFGDAPGEADEAFSICKHDGHLYSGHQSGAIRRWRLPPQ